MGNFDIPNKRSARRRRSSAPKEPETSEPETPESEGSSEDSGTPLVPSRQDLEGMTVFELNEYIRTHGLSRLESGSGEDGEVLHEDLVEHIVDLLDIGD